MRRLSVKQKNIVKSYYEQNKLDNKAELLAKLEAINDYETLWCDLDRLISDLECLKWCRDKDYKQVIRDFN